jgi:hypothetical protein
MDAESAIVGLRAFLIVSEVSDLGSYTGRGKGLDFTQTASQPKSQSRPWFQLAFLAGSNGHRL